MTSTHPPRLVLRRIGAVLAGMLFVIIASTLVDVVLHAAGVFPPWGQTMSDSLFLLATAYRILITIAGGFIAARLAPDRPMQHVLAMGLLGIILGFAGAAATWNKGPEFGPRWYPIALIVTAVPCTWIGGRMYPATRQAPA